MNTYKYRPYYQYNGPSVSQPLREKLSDEDQERNIKLFYEDVQSMFEDENAAFSIDSEGVVSVQTDIPKQECDDRIAKILVSPDLYGNKL